MAKDSVQVVTPPRFGTNVKLNGFKVPATHATVEIQSVPFASRQLGSLPRQLTTPEKTPNPCECPKTTDLKTVAFLK